MSYYTVFDTEAVVTSTTTNNTMIASDLVLVHSVAGNKKYQSTVGCFGSQQAISTSSSTGTNLPPYGVSFLQMGTGGSSATQFILNDPPSKGLLKIIYMSSTTSTANLIYCQSTGTTIYTTGAATANSINIQGAGAGSITLTSVSTTQWALLAKTGTVATTLTTV